MKTNILKLLLIYICYFPLFAQAQISFGWVQSIGGIENDQSCSVAVDDLGYIYTTGVYKGSMNINLIGAENIQLTSMGDQDIFITKQDNHGNFIWVKSIGGTQNDVSNQITVDHFGNIYVTGNFRSVVDFDPGSGVTNLDAGSSIAGSYYSDIFLLKITEEGNFVWVKKYGGINSDEGYCVVSDPNGDIYIGGKAEGVIDFGMDSYTIHNEFFLLKLDTNGEFLWFRTLEGTQTSPSLLLVNPYNLTIDNEGNLYVAGVFRNSIDFDPGTEEFIMTSEGVAEDGFILKLTPDGLFIWARQIRSESVVLMNGITTDNNGNVYAVGSFTSTTDFDPTIGEFILTPPTPNAISGFILKLTSNGIFIWVKQQGGNLTYRNRSITLDNDNNIYTTGTFRGITDFDPSETTYNLEPINGNDELFVSKLDIDGNFILARRFGDTGAEIGFSIVFDGEEGVYVVGKYWNTVNFDPNGGENNITTAGGEDGFILKLKQETLSIKATEIQNSLVLYPNPVNNILNIEGLEVGSTVDLIDVKNKIVKRIEMINQINTVDLSDLQSGIYIIHATKNSEYIGSQKLIIQRQ